MTHGAPAPYATEGYQKFKQFYFGNIPMSLPALQINSNTVIYVLNIMGGHPSHIKYYAEDLISGFKEKYKYMMNTINGVITAEGKSIPLVYEIARQLDLSYVVLRKCHKGYMGDKLVSAEMETYTTDEKQSLYLDNKDILYVRNKSLLFVDDVISTGATLNATERIVYMAGGVLIACMAMATEGGYKPSLPNYTFCDLPVIKLKEETLTK